jgi:hypothetical protein
MRKVSLVWIKMLSLLSFFHFGCEKSEPAYVNAKVFALNPEEYVDTLVAVKGKVVQEGPSSAWSQWEDETGRILVSTETVPYKVACPVGSRVAARGVLRRLSGEQGLYFSLKSLLHCSRI